MTDYIINLDPDFKPIDSFIPLDFKTFTFKGGETHFQLLNTEDIEDESNVIITHRVNTVEDFFLVLLVSDAIDRLRCFGKKHLFIPYFPAARQDRVCNKGEPLTAAVYANLINLCKFNTVGILSPHSEVVPALLNNVSVLDEHEFVRKVIAEQHEMYGATEFNIICPDAGAGKRVGKVTKDLIEAFPDFTFHLIRCEKERDVRDGSLKGFYVQSDNLEGNPCIIVDDIVAMGGTFIGLAKELRDRNAGELSIFTSHADCQEGLEKLAEVFNTVYTTDSRRNILSKNNIRVLKNQIFFH